MATFRYYLSDNPASASPQTDELETIVADSPQLAIEKLFRKRTLPANWQSLWAHFLVWCSVNGEQRGFESVRLSDVIQSPND